MIEKIQALGQHITGQCGKVPTGLFPGPPIHLPSNVISGFRRPLSHNKGECLWLVDVIVRIQFL